MSLNETPTYVGHFVSSSREKEKGTYMTEEQRKEKETDGNGKKSE